MRILALTNLYPNPYQPNRAPFNRQQLRALAAEHAVEVIAPISWTHELAARRDGRGATLDRLRICDGMRVHHPRYLFTPKMLRGWYGRFFLNSVRRCFLEAVGSFRPDVVLGCWAYPDGWAAVRLAREAGLPVAIKVHGSDVLGLLQRRQGRLSNTIDALKSADAVIAVSRHLANEAVVLGADRLRTHVVYNGIDTSLFHPGCRDEARRRLGVGCEERIVLFVGNLVEVKGLDTLIAACRRLIRAGARFRCYLVGDGPLRSRLESEIARHDLAGWISLVGARRLEQLPDWYRSADLVVLPSYSEGVPNVLLEASACGTPFIASRVGGIPEMADDAQLVPPGDDAALADKIAASLSAPHPLSRRTLLPRNWSDSARALASVLRRMHEHTTARVAAAG